MSITARAVHNDVAVPSGSAIQHLAYIARLLNYVHYQRWLLVLELHHDGSRFVGLSGRGGVLHRRLVPYA